MGYVDNFLPKALGKLGHEVHLITTDLQVYADQVEFYNSVYKDFLGDRIVETGVFQNKWFTLHRNKHSDIGGIHVENLKNKLIELKPDIVYLFEILTVDFMTVVSLKKELNFNIFSESRLHTSILHFPRNLEEIKYYLSMNRLGRKTSKFITKYYPIAKDVSFNINLIYGVPKSKIQLSSLGVDTDFFSSARFTKEQVSVFRMSLNIYDDDFLCIYTGRLNEDKNPMILANAINYLNQIGFKKIKGLFVGKGIESYVNKISLSVNCIVKDFVPNEELPLIYSSSNIGVWPRQESTSRLDAMSCGVPIIINNTSSNKKLVDGCGYLLKDNNFIELAKIISFAYQNKKSHNTKSINSIKRISSEYSWDTIARNKLKDFKTYK